MPMRAAIEGLSDFVFGLARAQHDAGLGKHTRQKNGGFNRDQTLADKLTTPFVHLLPEKSWRRVTPATEQP